MQSTKGEPPPHNGASSQHNVHKRNSQRTTNGEMRQILVLGEICTKRRIPIAAHVDALECACARELGKRARQLILGRGQLPEVHERCERRQCAQRIAIEMHTLNVSVRLQRGNVGEILILQSVTEPHSDAEETR